MRRRGRPGGASILRLQNSGHIRGGNFAAADFDQRPDYVARHLIKKPIRGDVEMENILIVQAGADDAASPEGDMIDGPHMRLVRAARCDKRGKIVLARQCICRRDSLLWGWLRDAKAE